MILIGIYLGLLVGCALYALARGGADERFAAGVAVVATGLTVLLLTAGPSRFANVEKGVVVVDIAAAAALFGLAMRSRRYWPMMVAALQLCEVLAHFARAIVPSITPFAYSVLLQVWGDPILLVIIVGTWRHDRRRRIHVQAIDQRIPRAP